MRGTASGKLYQALLDDALDQPGAQRQSARRSCIRKKMPWEMSRQGLPNIC